jgi:hypothetical protein
LSKTKCVSWYYMSNDSKYKSKCGLKLYSEAVDLSTTPRDSKEVICFLKSASLSLVRKRGGSLLRLSAHLSLFTDMDNGGTTAGRLRTVDENISENSRHRDRSRC